VGTLVGDARPWSIRRQKRPRSSAFLATHVVSTSRDAGSNAPPLVFSASRRLLLLTIIRLALGLAGLGAALALGGSGAATTGAFVLGSLGAAFTLAADRRFVPRKLEEPLALPSEALVLPAWRAALVGLFPSTAGVSLLAAVSLAFETTLAGLLAGVLAGMGVAGAASLLALGEFERRRSIHLLGERGGRRVFSRPRRV
jgi:hypothetical protein